MPVIVSHVNIAAIENTTSPISVEQTYIMLWRYVKKILEEPRLSRVAIGYPGFLLVLIGVMAIFNLLQQALLIALIFLGIIMIIRGFNLEDVFIDMWRRNPSGTLLTAIGLVVFSIAAMFTWLTITGTQTPQREFKIAGSILENTLWLYGLSISLPVLGALIRMILVRSIRAWRYVVMLITIAMFSVLLRDIGAVLLSLPDTATTREIIDIMWRSNAFQSLMVIVITIIIVSALLQSVEKIVIRSRARKQGSGSP